MFPVRKFYIEQIFVSVRMQFHKHVDTQPVKRFDSAMRYIHDIKSGTLPSMRFYCANALVVRNKVFREEAIADHKVEEY